VSDRPEFTHKKERHGLIGPFSGRQLAAILVTVVFAVIVLVAATTPLGTVGAGPGPVDPRATAYIIDEAPEVGLRPGDAVPELSDVLEDGTTYELTDLDGKPIRMADLRKSGKAVWLNFFATWCPPCQSETPVLREISEKYADRGLEVIAVSVQETSPADVQDYADKYELKYTIGFDGAGRIFRAYKVYALPTQFFIDPMGVIRAVAQGPLTVESASAYIEPILPPAPAYLGGDSSPSP
jgi:thiol-disulfide isomerase/thioredoxin